MNPRFPFLMSCATAMLALACAGEPPREEGAPSSETGEQALSSDTVVSERPTFGGIYVPSTADRPMVLERTFDQFVADYGYYWDRNYRLVSLGSHVRNGQIFYNGVFTPSSSAQYYVLFRTVDQFAADYNLRTGQGYRLVSVSNVVLNGTPYWTGVFSPSSAGHVLGLARTSAQFGPDFTWWQQRGHGLAALTSTVVNGQPSFTTVFSASTTTSQVQSIGRTVNQFISDNNTFKGQGYRLSCLSTYVLNDVVYYNAVWNASSANVVANLGSPRADFEAERQAQAGNNMRLAAILTPSVEGLAINRLSSSVSNSVRASSVGSAVTVKVAGTGANAATAAGRFRMPVDGESLARVGDRINSASVTKLLTATAVMKLLSVKRMTQNSLVQSFLPSDWTRGPNIGSLTFGQLLSHTSGLRGSNTGDWLDYNSLRNMIAGGRSATPSGGFARDYMNANFAIFRIIIPYMNGFSETGVSNKDTATTNAYLNYMNQQILSPAGITSWVSAQAPAGGPLYYPFPDGGARGFVWGDLNPQTGGGFLYLSSWELGDFLKAFMEDRIIPVSWRGLMEATGYGFDAWNQKVRHGLVTFKGGFIPQGAAQVNTGAVTFSTGAVVGVTVNSPVGVNIFNTVVNAYNSSWIPLR